MEKELLRDAFLEFSRASESLIAYYSLLEKTVEALKREIEQKNRELESTKEDLRTILDSLPVAVIVMEEDRVLFSNNRAREMRFEPILERINLDGKKEGETKISASSYRWKRESLSGRKNQEIVVIEDTTEVEKMRERLEMDQRLKAMGEMALRIAHEIKNPLGSMELFASMLLKDTLEEKQKSYVEHISEGIRNIDRIVNNLLSYTKPKSLCLRKVRLSDVIREILDFMRLSFEQSGIELTFREREKGPKSVDPHLMKLAVMNLLMNAKEALDQGGKIEIEVKEEGKFTVLVVADNGRGMTEEVKKSIFNPFFTTKEKGVGLGLFTVYNIVKAHGGFIEVESKVNEGTRFTIFLPTG